MKYIDLLIEGYDPDIVADAETACMDQGRTAAYMVRRRSKQSDINRFVRLYSDGYDILYQSKMVNASNSEAPCPEDLITNVDYNRNEIKLLKKYQEEVDANFDEELFVDLADGDTDAPYTGGDAFPFSPYNRFWQEFIDAIVEPEE